MPNLRRATAAAALAALLLTAGACSSDDDSASETDPTSTAADGEDSGADDSGSDAGSDNPCDTVTQEQWTAIFGEGVTKSDASGSVDNCNVLTSGSSPGHEISLANLASVGTTSFDEAVAGYASCSGSPTDVDVADQAILDTSCLETAGSAWVIAEDGDDILLVYLSTGAPAEGDPAEIGDTLTEVAAGMVDAR